MEFLKELLTQNEQLATTAKLAEKSASALSLVQNQITVLEKENAFLRAQIIQFGIDAAASNSQPSNVNRQLLNSPLAQSLLNTVAQASMAATPPQPPAPPPPQAPPPPTPNSQVTAQQLLISLAQSLTNSPLLTTPAQPLVSTSPPRLPTSVAVTSTPTHLPPPMQAVSPIPSHQTHVTPHPVPAHLTTPQQVSPSPHQQQAQVTPSHQQAQTSNSSQSLAPLISSLVQTLASLANPTTTTVQSLAPPPPPQPVHKASPPPRAQTPPQATSTSGGGGGLSAAAAASLLNTLIMAQNVLTHTGTGGVAPGGGGDSMLSSMGLDAVSRGEQ